MSTGFHGRPCWFELMAGDLAAARTFYSGLLGWEIADAGMPGFTYLLAGVGPDKVAGLLAREDPAMPSFWMIYLAVDDVDATLQAVTADGGQVHKPATDIPGTGRFAIVTDPQGAAFGLLQPLPMPDLPEGATGAFDRNKVGHGNWLDLQTTDQAAAMEFYGRHFGWAPSRSMPMGEMGSYDIFARAGEEMGGMMPRLAPVPTPFWLPYFGVADVAEAQRRTEDSGGKVVNGPHEVPGEMLVFQARDPQGVLFAVVGPKPA